MAQLITKRYATALFDIANEKGAMKEFQEQAQAICTIFKEQQDYLMILNHPRVLIEEKIEMLEKAFDGQVADELLGLLVLVVKKGRQDYMVEILDTFLDMVEAVEGILKVSITSAIALKEEQLAQIQSNIEKSTGKKTQTEVTVDPSLMGGLIIRVGDKVVDGSVKGQLGTLKSQLSDLRLV